MWTDENKSAHDENERPSGIALPGWAWALLLAVVLSGIYLLIEGVASRARADPPQGVNLNSPLHEWFEAQHSVGGAWCCNISDGHILSDTDWRIEKGGYEILLMGEWIPVPSTALRDTSGGPNPTGKAIAWYTETNGYVTIYCFAPGMMY